MGRVVILQNGENIFHRISVCPQTTQASVNFRHRPHHGKQVPHPLPHDLRGGPVKGKGGGGGEKGNPQLLGRQLAPKRHGIRYDPIGGNPFHIPADLLIQGQCGADNQVNGKGQILAHPGAVLRGGRHPQRGIVTGDKGRAGFLNDLLKGREGIVPDLIPPGNQLPHHTQGGVGVPIGRDVEKDQLTHGSTWGFSRKTC